MKPYSKGRYRTLQQKIHTKQGKTDNLHDCKENFVPRLAGFISSAVMTCVILASTLNYGIESESNIQIFAVLVFAVWLILILTAKGRIMYTKSELLVFTLVFAAASVCLANYVWNSGYLTTDPLAEMNTGVRGDTLHHTIIVESILNYGHPSLLVNSDAFYNYHFGSHVIMSFISWITKVPPYYTYNYLYPVVFLPLYLFLTLSVCNDMSAYLKNGKKLVTADAFLILWFVISAFPAAVLNLCGIWKRSWIISESFLIALVLALLYFKVLFFCRNHGWFEHPIRKWIFHIVISPVFVLMTGLSKISVGFLLCIGIIYYHFRMHTSRIGYWALNCYYLVCFLALYFLPGRFNSAFSSANNQTYFEILSFYRTFVNKECWPLHFLLLYFFAGVLIIWRICKGKIFHDIRCKRCIPEEILLVVCLAGAAPGMILNIVGGSAAYFSYVQQLPAVMLLISYGIPESIVSWWKQKGRSSVRFSASICCLCLCIAVCWNCALSTLRFGNALKTRYKNRTGYFNFSEGAIPFFTISSYAKSPYVRIVEQINMETAGNKEDYYLFLDESASIWDNFSSRTAVIYFYPAMTGIVEIGALYQENGSCYYGNGEKYDGVLHYKADPEDIRMTLEDALTKCEADGKSALVYVHDETVDILPVPHQEDQ